MFDKFTLRRKFPENQLSCIKNYSIVSYILVLGGSITAAWGVTFSRSGCVSIPTTAPVPLNISPLQAQPIVRDELSPFKAQPIQCELSDLMAILCLRLKASNVLNSVSQAHGAQYWTQHSLSSWPSRLSLYSSWKWSRDSCNYFFLHLSQLKRPWLNPVVTVRLRDKENWKEPGVLLEDIA